MGDYKSEQLTDIANKEALRAPIMTGKLRIAQFYFAVPSGLVVDESVELVWLPPGDIVVLGDISKGFISGEAGSYLDIGWEAYYDLDKQEVAGNAIGFANSLNTGSPGLLSLAPALAPTTSTKEFSSSSGVIIAATFTDVAPAEADIFRGYFIYVVK